jgi:hypothetical protein
MRFQRLAHATKNKGHSPASPLQALVGMRSSSKTVLIGQLNFAIFEIEDNAAGYLPWFVLDSKWLESSCDRCLDGLGPQCFWA